MSVIFREYIISVGLFSVPFRSVTACMPLLWSCWAHHLWFWVGRCFYFCIDIPIYAYGNLRLTINVLFSGEVTSAAAFISLNLYRFYLGCVARWSLFIIRQCRGRIYIFFQGKAIFALGLRKHFGAPSQLFPWCQWQSPWHTMEWISDLFLCSTNK